MSGEGIAATTAKPLGDGVYAIEADWVDVPGAYALTFVVTAGETADLLNGTLEIPAPQRADEIPWSAVLVRPETWILLLLAAAFGVFLAFAFRPIRLREEAEEQEQPAQPTGQPRLNVVEGARKAAKAMLFVASLAVPDVTDARVMRTKPTSTHLPRRQVVMFRESSPAARSSCPRPRSVSCASAHPLRAKRARGQGLSSSAVSSPIRLSRAAFRRRWTA